MRRDGLPESPQFILVGEGWQGLASAWGEDVELVAFGVGEPGPWHVALAEVDVGGAEGPQPGHLCRLIVTRVRPEVEMCAVLHGLHAGRADELQKRPDTLGGAQPRLVAGHLMQSPVHRLAPEPGHGPRIRAVNDHRGDRPGVPVDRPGLQRAELVTLRVGEDRPRDVALAHVCGRRAKILQARDQVRLVGRGGGGQIDMHAVLHRLGLGGGKDVDADGGGVGIGEADGFNVGHAGSLAVNPQPSASAQNRPTAESSRAFITT